MMAKLFFRSSQKEGDEKMAVHRRWFSVVRRVFLRSSCQATVEIDNSTEIIRLQNGILCDAADPNASIEKNGKWIIRRGFSLEDLAAIKIQSCFRGHLARRAFRALKSLVKLQAVVRGVCVRRQARIAVRCMQAMMRLQVKVRARQLLQRTEGMRTLQAAEA